MKTRKQFFSGVVTGILLTVLIAAVAVPALALSQMNIGVYSGVNVYVDDVKLDPKDANGKSVPVFAYDGTTYLPIRAISSALGKPIVYDPSTYSVYVGKHSSASPAEYLGNKDYFYSTGREFITTSGWKDNLGNARNNVTCLSYASSQGSRVYLLNGQYTAVSGTLFQNYDYRSETGQNTIEIYGDGKLLYSDSVEMGVFPKDFKVNIAGVLQLEVKLNFRGVGTTSASKIRSYAGVADLALWT